MTTYNQVIYNPNVTYTKFPGEVVIVMCPGNNFNGNNNQILNKYREECKKYCMSLDEIPQTWAKGTLTPPDISFTSEMLQKYNHNINKEFDLYTAPMIIFADFGISESQNAEIQRANLNGRPLSVRLLPNKEWLYDENKTILEDQINTE